MKNKIKVFGLALGIMAMSFGMFTVTPSFAQEEEVPGQGPCYMHMARCNGGSMSLDNCRTRTTAETCRGANCNTCTTY